MVVAVGPVTDGLLKSLTLGFMYVLLLFVPNELYCYSHLSAIGIVDTLLFVSTFQIHLYIQSLMNSRLANKVHIHAYMYTLRKLLSISTKRKKKLNNRH